MTCAEHEPIFMATKFQEGGAVSGYSLEAYTQTEQLVPAAMVKSIGKNRVAELLEELIGKKKVAELLEDLVDRSPGAPTVVPASDKRPAYNRADDFEKLD